MPNLMSVKAFVFSVIRMSTARYYPRRIQTLHIHRFIKVLKTEM